MTAYTAPTITAGKSPRLLQFGITSVISIVSQTTALALNDTIAMVQVPSDPSVDQNGGRGGPSVVGIVMDVDSLDSGNTLVVSIGDSANAARYWTVSTMAQGGGYFQPTKSGIVGYQPFGGAVFTTYTTTSYSTYTVVVKCTTTPNTWVNGNIRMLFEYTLDP